MCPSNSQMSPLLHLLPDNPRTRSNLKHIMYSIRCTIIITNYTTLLFRESYNYMYRFHFVYMCVLCVGVWMPM